MKPAKHPITRREFGRLVSIFGFTAAFGSLEKLAMAKEPITYASAKAKAKEIKDAASKNKPDYVIRFGISGHTPKTMAIFPIGYYKFAEDLATRTDGRIKVELFGANSLCNEISCPQKVLTSTLEMAGCSTQNAAQTYKYYNSIDYPFLFPSRASMHYFLYSDVCEKYFRKVMRDKYNVEFLWTSAELRDIFTGLKYKNKPRVRVPKDIAGAKIRVTGTDLGRIGLKLMGVNPIPLNWSETLEGLRSGVVDGQETMTCAVASFNMAPVTSQDIAVGFMSATEHAMISHTFMKKLPTQLQEDILETAFEMQQYTQKELERSLVETIGYQDPPKPGTIFDKGNVKVNILTTEERNEWRKMADPAKNPDPYKAWRKRLTKMAGKDVFDIFYNFVREIPEETPVDQIKPRRWWT